MWFWMTVTEEESLASPGGKNMRLKREGRPQKMPLGGGLPYLGWSVCVLYHTKQPFETDFTSSPSLHLHVVVVASFSKKHIAPSWTQAGTLPPFSVRLNHQGSLVPFCRFRFHLGHGYVSSVVTSKTKMYF